jgi:putative Holliday junction resolvase
MRVLGLDVGRKRIGLAISDPSRTLARPLTTVTVGRSDAVAAIAAEIRRLEAEEDGVSEVVVGVPRHLDGAASEETAHVEAFIDRLRKETSLPIHPADERLTSREAESRLAEREKDWRERKKRLDAAAAAIILQDYLDR